MYGSTHFQLMSGIRIGQPKELHFKIFTSLITFVSGVATLSINIKRMKEWYKEKMILQQMNINLKNEDLNLKTDDSEGQDDSVSLYSLGYFGDFCPET